MREWRKVTKPEELVDGQRVRYSQRKVDFFGEDDDKRFFDKNDNEAHDETNLLRSGDLFEGYWEQIEALFDDGVPVCRESAKPTPVKPEPAKSQPVDDGGPAFPFGQISELTGQPINGFFSPGMTLRDWFAGMAMQGLAMYERSQGIPWPEHADKHLHQSAEMAYMLADAMLKARAAE